MAEHTVHGSTGRALTVQAFYQLALWLPLVVPTLAMLLIGGPPETPLDLPYELLVYSLVYGGIPYILPAIVATIWIDKRSEAEIRRLAVRSPFWVIAAWIPLIALVSLRAGSLKMFLGLLALGGGAIMALGYAYVAIVFVFRAALGRSGWIDPAERAQQVAAG